MTPPDPTNTTMLLRRASEGDLAARSALFEALYEQLRGLARGSVARRPESDTIQPTALVHEVWLRISASGQMPVESRQHFLHIAASVMRRILIDQARRRATTKRGGGSQRELLDEVLHAWERAQSVDVVALDSALAQLRATDERLAQIIELRFFGGLTEEEVGDAMGLTRRQVQHAWKLARGFLMREIERADPDRATPRA